MKPTDAEILDYILSLIRDLDGSGLVITDDDELVAVLKEQAKYYHFAYLREDIFGQE